MRTGGITRKPEISDLCAEPIFAITLRCARGDMEAGWREAEVVVENEYKTASLQHVTMETHCATAPV